MLNTNLIEEIEHMRSKLNDLAASGADYYELLKVSQELDNLIAHWYRVAA